MLVKKLIGTFDNFKNIKLGVIQKQSVSGTIYSYIGVLLGFITTGILFPRILSTDEVGLLRILVSYSVLFAQIAGLGINAVTVKVFPYFRDYDRKHHGYLGLSLLVSLVGLVISISAYILLKDWILDGSNASADLFTKYFYYVVPLIIFTLLFNVFDTYYRVLYNAVTGIIYREVAQRSIILIVIVLYFFGAIDFHMAVILYTLALILPAILFLILLIYDKQLFLIPEISFIGNELKREMINVGIFGILASFSSILVMTIDSIMVERMLGLSMLGIYTIAFFFGTLILVPLRTMGKISSVVIADAWKANDIRIIDIIYKKSSISLSVIGLLLLIGIWANINNIFQIVPATYLPGKPVILIIGIANLIDIALGVNPQIIVNSKYFRFISYFLIIFVILIVLLNYLLIPIYGIVGAAIATLISKFIYNIIKFLFVYRKFKLQPFTYKMVLLYVIGFFTYGISLIIPQQSNFIIDMIIRSFFIIFVFAPLIYYFNISEDISNKVNSVVRSIFK